MSLRLSLASSDSAPGHHGFILIARSLDFACDRRIPGLAAKPMWRLGVADGASEPTGSIDRALDLI
jgi:hypothetical protein